MSSTAPKGWGTFEESRLRVTPGGEVEGCWSLSMKHCNCQPVKKFALLRPLMPFVGVSPTPTLYGTILPYNLLETVLWTFSDLEGMIGTTST